jgi:glutamate racemase
MDSRPIGLFDSGFGGLTVMREVVKILPRENLIYLGDTARLPYGNKSPQTVLGYALENAEFLIQKGCKLIMIPCHTACSHALETLQKQLPVPVIGVIESGFELLMEASPTRRVAVLGTSSTIGSGIYQSLILNRDPNTQIYAIACPLFVPLIEDGFYDHPAAELIAREYLSPISSGQVDAILLACTHYPLIRRTIQKVVGPKISLIEPAKPCALQAYETLSRMNQLNLQTEPPSYEFYASDDPAKFHRLGKIFFGKNLGTVNKLDISQYFVEKKQEFVK